MSAGAQLELREVAKRFPRSGGGDAVAALEGVSLTAAPGELIAVIGPSGCGKSTILHILAGLEQATSGELLIDGAPAPERLGTCALMPQRDGLLPWRRVIDNVTVGLELRGVSRARARERATPLLERFGLGDFAHAWPWQLSGGMRQRAAFLRTLLADRPVMLLDEPFGALDSITRAELQDWLLEVWREVGSTAVLITHDVAEAVLLADRVYVLSPRPGRVTAVVDVDLPRPRTPDVRESAAFAAYERRLRAALRGSAHADQLGTREPLGV